MAILLSVRNLEKSFGAKTLFSDLSFGIETGDRIGLIGPNGAGKSTLLKILADQMPVDDGEISRSRGLKLGFLEQSPRFSPEMTVFDAVAENLDDPEQLSSVQRWLARLDLNQGTVTPESLIGELSGGWKKRVALARELVREPDLLLLDEPTNHLDVESILWLERFLESASFATLTVTHDRLFLQRVSNQIMDLDKRNPNGLLKVKGTYADYLEAKEGLMHAQARREEVVQNTLRRETEWLRRGAKARQTKQQARIDRAAQLGDEAQDLRERNLSRKAQIDFQSADRHPQKLIAAEGIKKSYNGRTLFENLDCIIGPKTRLGLLGTNGSGKTTLIRVLLGEDTPDQGVVRRADKLSVAYFAQYHEDFDPKQTVLRTVCPDGDYVNYRGQFIFARSYLDRFLFRAEQMDMPVEKLSGGEKSRLRVAELMLLKANVLILDEPTNDLDLATLNVLEESLREFDGAVILVTHDRYFLDQVANEILAFQAGSSQLERFADYSQWEAWIESRAAQTQAERRGSENSSGGNKKSRLTYNDKRELEGIEAVILAEEALLEKFQGESQKPENSSNSQKLTELYTQIASQEKKIEKLYARWAELEGRS